jgi:polyribonucleotide nucleotidyltransferase
MELEEVLRQIIRDEFQVSAKAIVTEVLQREIKKSVSDQLDARIGTAERTERNAALIASIQHLVREEVSSSLVKFDETTRKIMDEAIGDHVIKAVAKEAAGLKTPIERKYTRRKGRA